MSERNHGIDAYADAVVGRIDAIAVAHALLSEARWRGVELARLVAALGAAAAKPTIAIEGPPVLLAAGQVQPLAIVPNELLASAVDGSAPEGQRVEWQVEAGQVAINIVGSGTAEDRLSSGTFGARMVEQVAKRQLYGQVHSPSHTDRKQITASLPVYAPRACECRITRPSLTCGVGRKTTVAYCAQVVDGARHRQSMLLGDVDCPVCATTHRAELTSGGAFRRVEND